MYRYEEYKFSQLQDDPGLDPADPEVLYAMAQCFRAGKGGVLLDAEAARELLRAAAQAGSEQAQKELEAEQPPAVPLPDYSSMSSSELTKLAEEGDLQANVLCCRSCRKLGDRTKEKYYLDRCVKEAITGRQDVGLRREALEEAGAFYQAQDPAQSRRLYELARELGSIAACGVLLDYYARGVGGEAVPELEEGCARQLAKQGTPELLYQYAVWCMKKNGGQPSADARDALHQVTERTEDPLLKARAMARLHLLTPSEVPCEDFLSELWQEGRGIQAVREELNLLYLKELDLPVEPALAEYMAKVCPQHRRYWLGRAGHS